MKKKKVILKKNCYFKFVSKFKAEIRQQTWPDPKQSELERIERLLANQITPLWSHVKNLDFWSQKIEAGISRRTTEIRKNDNFSKKCQKYWKNWKFRGKNDRIPRKRQQYKKNSKILRRNARNLRNKKHQEFEKKTAIREKRQKSKKPHQESVNLPTELQEI